MAVALSLATPTPGLAQSKPTTRRFEYVGACVGTHPALERVPGRVWEDASGRPVDPLALLRQSGVNAWRLFAAYRDPARITSADSRDVDQREANFALDFGDPADALALARRVHAADTHVLLTLQFGQDGPVDNWHEYLPPSWVGLDYPQTLARLDVATRNLLRPYLLAGVQPAVIIVENEADSGMLFQTLGDDGKMKVRDTARDPNDNTAGGHYQNFPKYASYFKRVILSAKDELRRQGFDPAATRFALHTTTNPFHARSTFDRVFKNRPDADRTHYDEKGKSIGPATVVPAELRDVNLADLIDIMGFSVYPDDVQGPAPADPAARQTLFKTLVGDLQHFDATMRAAGRYAAGPWRGQFRKQALVVEFATDDPALVDTLFETLSPYPWVAGALWWEPTYGHNNWYHGQGSLFRTTAFDRTTHTWARLKPVPWLAKWGGFAR